MEGLLSTAPQTLALAVRCSMSLRQTPSVSTFRPRSRASAIRACNGTRTGKDRIKRTGGGLFRQAAFTHGFSVVAHRIDDSPCNVRKRSAVDDFRNHLQHSPSEVPPQTDESCKTSGGTT